MAIDIVLNLIRSGLTEAKSDLQGVADAGKGVGVQAAGASKNLGEVERALQRVGSNGGLAQAEAKAKRFWDTIDDSKKAVENLTRSLETVRNAGLAIGAAGVGGLMLSENLIGAGLEADRLGAKMETLLSGANLNGASDQIKGMAKEIAGLKGLDDDQLGAAIAQAVVTGRTRALTEFGIVIAKSGQEAITAAYKISDMAGRQETLKQVTEASTRAIAEMRENTNESAQAIGEFNVRFENMQEQVGMGAARAKAALLGGILSPIMDIVDASPGLQNIAGGLLYIGSTAASIIGGFISLASQIGILVLTKQSLAAATGANAIATTAETAATVASGAAAGRAAIGWRALAAAKLLARNPILGVGVLAIAAALALRHKVESDIAKETGTMEGDTNAIEATVKRANATAAGTVAMPTTGDTGSTDTDDGDGTTSRSGRKSNPAREAERAAKEAARAQTKAQREQARAQAKLAKAREKDAKERDALAERIAQNQQALAEARLEAEYEIKIARLEAVKTKENTTSIELKIAALQAEKVRRMADVKARWDDSFAEGSGRAIADVQANTIMERARIAAAAAKNSLIPTLTQTRELMNGEVRGGTGTMSGSSPLFRKSLTAQVRSVVEDVLGNRVATVELKLGQSRMERDGAAYGF